MNADTISGSAPNRAIARLAIGGIRRHLRRSVLVVALLAVPIAAAIVAAAGSRALFPSGEEQARWHYGAADVVVQQPGFLPFGADAVSLDPEELAANTGLDRHRAEQLQEWLISSDPTYLGDVVASVGPDVDTAVVEHSWSALGARGIEVLGIDPTSPVTQGIVTLDAGTWPNDGAEISLTPEAAAAYGVTIGDSVAIDGLGEFRVSGVHLQNADARARGALVLPGTIDMPSAVDHLMAGDGLDADAWGPLMTALAHEVGPETADLLLGSGNVYVAPAQDFYGYDAGAPLELDRPPVLAGFVAALLLLEVGLIAAAAHAAGARRRLREFGLLATIGANPDHIRRLVLFEAVALGVVSVVLGCIGGVVATWALAGTIADLPTHVVTDVGTHVSDLVAPVGVGLVAALLAAWWPARTSARVPVLSALAGRMPTRPLRFRAVPWALALAGSGLLILGAVSETARTDPDLSDGAVLVMLFGSLLVLAGAAVGGTWFVGRIAAHADRLPLSLRLVARDAGRQQFRSAMAIAGLVVVLAAPIGIAAAVVTAEADSRSTFVPEALEDEVVIQGAPLPDGEELAAVPADVVDAIAGVAPGSVAGSFERLGMRTTVDDGFGETEWLDMVWVTSSEEDVFGGSMTAALGTRAAVAALRLGSEAQDLLDRGVVVAVGSAAPEGPVQLQTSPVASVPVDAVRVGDRGPAWSMPGYLIPETMADQLGLEPIDSTTVFVADAPLTAEMRDGMWALVRNDTAGVGQYSIGVGSPFDAFSVRVQRVALPIALGVVLVIGGCLVAIAATESDRDISTMLRVGGEPALRRRFLGLQGWYHAALAAALATPVGLLMLVALRRAIADPPPLVIPWMSLAAVVIVIPLVLGLVVAVAVRTRPQLMRS